MICQIDVFNIARIIYQIISQFDRFIEKNRVATASNKGMVTKNGNHALRVTF